MTLVDRQRGWAERLKHEPYALRIAYRDPSTPWYAKALSVLIPSYAFSPIDLIPDFIPVLGYLDALILLPFGIYLVTRIIPGQVMEAARMQAQEMAVTDRPVSRAAAVVVVLIWLLLTTWMLLIVRP